MGQQLPLLDYRAPTKLRATARDHLLVLETTGADRDAALDTLVDLINHLDRAGVPVLGQLAGVTRWPVDSGSAYVFTYPLVSTHKATDAVAVALAWWAGRGAA